MNDRKEQKFDDALMDAAASLPREIRPQRDLWPEIANALDGHAGGGWRRYGFFAQAAAVLLLVGASSGLTYLAVTDRGSTVSPVSGDVTRVFEPVSGSFGSQYNLGPDFQDARNNLAARLEQEMQNLSPEARKDVEKNLVTIRDAIVEINKALAKEPDNVLLQELLLRTYRDELAVMRRVSGLGSATMTRTDI